MKKKIADMEEIDVYTDIDIDTWKKHKKEIMAMSTDGRNYNDSDESGMSISVDMRIKKSDLKKLKEYANRVETREISQ